LSVDINVTERLPGIAYTSDDTQLYLYNEAGDVLAFSDDKTTDFSSRLLNYLVPESGTYYVAVTTTGNDPILELGQVNQLLGFEETGLANVAYDITASFTDVPDTARLFDIALEADPGNPIGEVLINGDEVLFIDLNGSRNTDLSGPLTIEVNAEEVNSPGNTLDNTIVFEDTLSFGLDFFNFILDFDEPFASTELDDIIDNIETLGITAIVPPDQLVQRVVFTEQEIEIDLDSLDTEFVRFQNSSIPGTYVYATGEEADSIRSNQPGFVEEGVAFSAAIEADDDLIALNRLESNQLPGTFLYVGEEELASINADPNFSNAFTDQGVAFYVYGAGAGEETPFSRFQNSDVPGTYLYATGEEADSIRANFPGFIDEGIAFEVAI
ncbi:MAG: hypothetical protein AAGA80_21090, partial [Cyanobacteria bacterium P01_F01_bin.143]